MSFSRVRRADITFLTFSLTSLLLVSLFDGTEVDTGRSLKDLFYLYV
jgi:hypothetical protein